MDKFNDISNEALAVLAVEKREAFDARYLAHFGGNRSSGHTDSRWDHVNCTR